MYRSRSGSNQPEPLSIDEPEGVKKGNGKTKKVISKKTPKRRSCNLIALQLAQGEKGLSLLALQWAQGAKGLIMLASPAMSTRSKRRLSL